VIYPAKPALDHLIQIAYLVHKAIVSYHLLVQAQMLVVKYMQAIIGIQHWLLILLLVAIHQQICIIVDLIIHCLDINQLHCHQAPRSPTIQTL
jgi:hypothetical protein